MYNLYKKYEEIINYLIMGVLTTLVSLVSYYLIENILNKFLDKNISIGIATTLSWILAVLFAYVTNKKYVFKTETDKNNTLKECYEFYKYRIFSLFIDLFFMWLFVNIFKIDDKVAKLINQVIITIVNYVFSKLFVFKKK